MSPTYRAINAVFKLIVRAMCRVDDSQWSKFPDKGPLIIAANHVNFVEVPLMVTHLLPRPITGLAKSENWERFRTRWLFEMWDAIPLRRGEADMTALRAAVDALNQGKLLAVAPEGTRTGDARLKEGLPGIVIVALKANAPILPVAYWGHEALWGNLRRLRRTDFHIRVGEPFILDAGKGRTTRDTRQQMIDEIMYQIAMLLPPQYRGHYADLSAATDQFLRFLPS